MEHSLDLLNNSISFFREAVRYAEDSENDASHWKFAIINLVQAMELALKESLRRIHPAFVYSNLDVPSPEKTISVSQAIARLRNEKIGNYAITESEAKQFYTAIKLRNQFVHYECSYQAEHVEAKFASIFAFMLFFYEDHLDVERQDIISSTQYSSILTLKNAKAELLRKTHLQLNAQDVGAIWLCPECGEDTFVVLESRCRLCECKEQVIECPNCRQETFEIDLVDITGLFDSSYEEGRLEIYNTYGFGDHACDSCYQQVKQEIKDKQFEEFSNQMEEEFHLRQAT